VRLYLMNTLHKEEKPGIPRQSHGTRRTMYGNMERGEQGREAKHSAAEPRNEENDVWKHGTRRTRKRSLAFRGRATERGERCMETRNEENKEEKPSIPRQSHGTRTTE